jgi:hypothetical protein
VDLKEEITMKNKKNLKKSYNYCGICGHTPKTSKDEPNYTTKWWDPDDGYKFGTLCSYCLEEFGDVKPKKGDYAYKEPYKLSNIDTDQDIVDLI